MTFYHVRLTPKGKGQDTEYLADLNEQELEDRFLKPRRDGDPITINGRTVSVDDIERMKITKSEVDSSQLRRVLDLSTRESSVLGLEPNLAPDNYRVVDKEIDVTNDFIVGPPGRKSDANIEGEQESRPPQNTREVFVVHGRNRVTRNALFKFLSEIGLRPLEWSELTQATGKPTPYIGEILEVAFSRAHAVVVLFTPDDEARLNERLWEENDDDDETEFTGQARPNVLFEAGMAMGRMPEQTVFVEVGKLRRFSDISGRHVVRLDTSVHGWKELARRLETVSCPVNWDGIDWQSAGDYAAAVDLSVQGQPRTAAEATQLSELEEKREYTDRTAQEIMDRAHFHTGDRATVHPEIGKWLRVDDIAWYAPITTNNPIEVTIGKPFEQVSLNFDNTNWRSSLASIKEGSRIVAEGRIVEVEFAGLTLYDCELLDVAE